MRVMSGHIGPLQRMTSVEDMEKSLEELRQRMMSMRKAVDDQITARGGKPTPRPDIGPLSGRGGPAAPEHEESQDKWPPPSGLPTALPSHRPALLDAPAAAAAAGPSSPSPRPQQAQDPPASSPPLLPSSAASGVEESESSSAAAAATSTLPRGMLLRSNSRIRATLEDALGYSAALRAEVGKASVGTSADGVGRHGRTGAVVATHSIAVGTDPMPPPAVPALHLPMEPEPAPPVAVDDGTDAGTDAAAAVTAPVLKRVDLNATVRTSAARAGASAAAGNGDHQPLARRPSAASIGTDVRAVLSARSQAGGDASARFAAPSPRVLSGRQAERRQLPAKDKRQGLSKFKVPSKAHAAIAAGNLDALSSFGIGMN